MKVEYKWNFLYYSWQGRLKIAYSATRSQAQKSILALNMQQPSGKDSKYLVEKMLLLDE